MLVEVWVDIMCPWCYLGKRRLEAALGRWGDEQVEIAWRSYELRPDHPGRPGITLGEGMQRWRGLSPQQVDKLFASIRRLGAEEGLELNLATVRPVNSFDAHRLTHLADVHGLRDAMTERLFRAHLTENIDVADHDVLTALAGEVGLDPRQAADMLARDRYAAEVRAEENVPGITAVPTTVVDGRHAVSGAASTDEYLALLRQGRATTTT